MNDIPNAKLERPKGWRRVVRFVFSAQGIFALLLLVTMVALFYAIENWRGHKAWTECKREFKAKGEELDWQAFIPKPVPDDQNVFKEPLIESWFVKTAQRQGVPARASALGNREPFTQFLAKKYGSKPVLAEVEIVPVSGTAIPDGPNVLANAEAVEVALTNALAAIRSFEGPSANLIVERYSFAGAPRRFFVRGQLGEISKTLADRLTQSPTLEWAKPVTAQPSTQSNVIRLVAARLKGDYPAADFLEWSRQFDPEFTAVREALQRPYARIDADYTKPFEIHIPNFVGLRTFAQAAGDRALARLLLGEPEAASRELDLVLGMERVAIAGQTTLVGAMIKVALAGLHIDIVRKGFENGLWQEAQWKKFQQQLAEVKLFEDVTQALRGGERAAIIYMFENHPRKELARAFSHGNKSIWRSAEARFILLAPRGWLEQNLAFATRLYQSHFEPIDLSRGHLDPRAADKSQSWMQEMMSHPWNPHRYLASVYIPNLSKAYQTAAKNLTFIRQARLACAIEQYRATHGSYPEDLEALTPSLVPDIPRDVILGQPLKYQRTPDGSFKLWSLAWNAVDDGGKIGQTATDPASLDWVWFGPRPNTAPITSATAR